MSELLSRTVYFTAPRRVEVRQERVTPSPEQRVLHSELIGISCGTELQIYRDTFPKEASQDGLAAVEGELEYPCAYGYMNVASDEDGKRYFAFVPHSTVFAAGSESLIEIGDLPAEDAVFLANMETAIGIVHDAAPRAGERILVLGQGVVGLLVSEILSRFGLVTLYAAEPREFRRSAAASITQTLLPAEHTRALEYLKKETGGRGVDIAINASGSANALQLALETLVFEGRVIEGSWYGDTPIELSLGRDFHRKRLSIESSQVSNVAGKLSYRWSKERRIGFVIELLHRIRPSRFITHRIPIGECSRAYELIDDPESTVLQPVLLP